MFDFKFNTKEDLEKSIINFYKIPLRSRNVIANKIHARLKELDLYIKVYPNNPILNYPSERFIVIDNKTENEYSKYKIILDTSSEEYNLKILEDMKIALNNITGVYEVINFCREQNNKADMIYLTKFPSHEDLLNVFKNAVSKINCFFLYNTNMVIQDSVMDDLEFIIAMNILSENHIKRLLLAPVTLSQKPVFTGLMNKADKFKNRLNELFNNKISIARQNADVQSLNRPLNDSALQAYLKIQKIGHQETLMQSYYNGDYSISDRIFDVDVELMCQIHERVSKGYPNLNLIDMIDKFKLEQHGIRPIMNKMYKGKDYYVHHKNGIQYLVYKSIVHEDRYYLVTIKQDGMFKSYRISINSSNSFMDKISMNSVLESTFITDFRKMDD